MERMEIISHSINGESAAVGSFPPVEQRKVAFLTVPLKLISRHSLQCVRRDIS